MTLPTCESSGPICPLPVSWVMASICSFVLLLQDGPVTVKSSPSAGCLHCDMSTSGRQERQKYKSKSKLSLGTGGQWVRKGLSPGLRQGHRCDSEKYSASSSKEVR